MRRMTQAQISMFRQMDKYRSNFERSRKKPKSWGFWFWMRPAPRIVTRQGGDRNGLRERSE